MDTLEKFRQELQHALTHLYDPSYQFSEQMYAATDCDPGKGPGAVQSEIIQLIESLESDPSVPSGSRIRQNFKVLHHRFVLRLTQEETGGQLHMSVRSVQRAQREATHMLARHLWERSRERENSADDRKWLLQVRQELLSLQRSAPGAECELGAAIRGALRIARATTARHGITVETQDTQSNLRVRSHPSALRQVLLSMIAELEQAMSSGRITLSAKHEGDRARITITACPVSAEEPINVSLARELLSVQGGSIESLFEGDRISLVAELPSATQPKDKVTVLAVDDNADLISLYESYCAGTAYEVVHVREGQRVFQAIKAAKPDIILLDVMLPDVDGWDLLLDLHADPATQTIPIIVCSVITDEQLALDLGAALYLRKPVWREQLIEAFDQTVSQAATGVLRDHASNPGAC